ncbi:DUF4176 domain-containing protein [Streptococcus loxodontisalivarius]|uniref:DUF4176 domain-containing protein n=1 Tax=Streptococcus loxodontisalivarius TaxID=1349415 RepID=A0ABS2PVQ6_9STRE|nr:DUF4176 domain-containing protein [Streptococcus loxodontisalivarius]MBM7643795.1 hypothetical protein [Streptococcus loxodontisalivarius]
MSIKILPLGSVVRLNDGDIKVMVIGRYPLYENKGEVGYFDYAACIYPTGLNSEENYFFNEEDIAEIFFEGYVDESEEEAQKIFKQQFERITVPHFKVENMENQN